jgi:hypothetical protein
MDEPTCVLTLASDRGITADDLTSVERHLLATWGARAIWRDIAAICRLAAAYGATNQPQRGLDVLDAIRGEHDETFYAPEIRRIRGELLLQSGERDDAEQWFRDALELAYRREERSLELRAATSLARLLTAKGHRADARRALAGIYASFTEGFETADVTAARVLLQQLG